ncbi:MAG: hypothetical protein TH68_06320 [Candidatus Synechococcus spongiarum 142]|uniref:ATPase AAA-type core domain-containing protein n=1 Tax=Candidatus Synechococcus spongiarum 142 TaxID=1608213 RepID=A0A6N3X820_9SYNE|nr:MAG: hypothetical protein TH68_06320 [Candidatus Synechococcus spongiarum 142]
MRHGGQQRIAELNHPRLAGVEVVPDHCSEDEKFLAPEDYEPWLDGSKAEIKRRFQPVWSSDAHRFAHLGRRWTWVKMTSPTLEGLRLALLDGDDSLKPSQAMEAQEHTFNTPPELAIESITVDQGKFIGRPEAITIPVNPYLNTIIGGRGTGKSTIIDFCRMALRREDELESNQKREEPLKHSFDRRMQVPKNRKEAGLLTQQTKTKVIYRKNGQRFILSWSQDGSARSLVRVNEQDHSPEEGDIRERFPVRIYSQKQLFTLAQNPNALLSVIDDGIQTRGGEIKDKIGKFRDEYLSLQARARAALKQSEAISTDEGKLRDIRYKIDVLQAGNQTQVIKRHQQLDSKNSSWKQALKEAMDAIASIKSQVSELTVADLMIDATAEDDQAQASLQKVHGAIKETINGLRQDLKHRIDVAQNDIARIQESDDAKYWQNEVVSIQRKLEKTREKLTQQGIANPNEYSDLLRSSKSLEEKIQNCRNQKADAEKLERDAVEVLSSYRKAHVEMNELRQSFLSEVLSKNENLIKIKVNQLSNYDDLTEKIGEILGTTVFERGREEMAKKIKQANGKPWDWENLDTLITDMHMRKLPDLPASWTIQDRRFLDCLQKLPPERVDRLALYCPEDEVEVEFREKKGGSWKPLPQGSPGQQAAALLTFILGHGKEPIIIDQPEDDLDNALIYELLVRRLREVKQHRQVIVVTHNPNIVVNGNAELVLSLKVDQGPTRIGCYGGLQDQSVRDEICRVMEGGREALERRYQWILLPERSSHAGC